MLEEGKKKSPPSNFITFSGNNMHLLFVHLNKGARNTPTLGSGDVICHLARAFH